MKPPAESLFDNLAARVRKQDYISTGNLACEYRPDMIAIAKLKKNSKKLTAGRRTVGNDRVAGQWTQTGSAGRT
jgi:hypothetical protein